MLRHETVNPHDVPPSPGPYADTRDERRARRQLSRGGNDEGGTTMATTSGNLAASKATSGRGGDGKRGRFGLGAMLAAGVATLGCVAALVFGGGQAEQAVPVQPQAAPA